MTQQVLSRGDRKAEHRRGRGCTAALVVLGLLVAVVAVAAVTAWQMLFKVENPVAAGQKVEYVVRAGESTSQIAESLAKQGIVGNALMFRLKARNSDLGTKLKPGIYSMATGMPYEVVLRKLSSGPDITYYTVTIPEGFTVRRVAARMAVQAHVSEGEMLDLVLHGAPQFAADHPAVNGAFSKMDVTSAIYDPQYAPPSKVVVKAYSYGVGAKAPEDFGPPLSRTPSGTIR